MKYYRSVALAIALAGGLALPAFAQTPAPTPDATVASPAGTSTPMPDAGIKKATPAPTRHVRHVSHHRRAKLETPPVTSTK